MVISFKKRPFHLKLETRHLFWGETAHIFYPIIPQRYRSMLVRISDIKHIQAHTHTHTQMDFFAAVFSEMSRILNYMSAGCYTNIENSLFSSFLSHTLVFQALSCLVAPFLLQQPPSVLIITSGLNQWLQQSPSYYLHSISFGSTMASVP